MVSFWFLPCLGIYLVGWILNAPLWFLADIFRAVDLILAAAAICLAVRRARSASWRTLLFWAALLVVFLLPGAFLEYPTDAWEHLRRLSTFDPHSVLASSEFKWKFSYFWGWTLLSAVPTGAKPFAVDCYSAFWQILLGLQCYRLARALKQERPLAWLQVIGFFTLFGSNVFTFRYYALASTALAYVAYLDALIVLLRYPRAGWWRLIPLLLLMSLNHIQEPLLFVIDGSAIAVFAELSRWEPRRRKRALTIATMALVFLLPPTFLLARHLGMGFFPFWGLRQFYLDTYGIHGWVSLLLAVALFPKYPLLATLCLAPTFVLAYPASSLILHRLVGGYGSFRVLYATPLSLMLVTVIFDCLRASRRWANRAWAVSFLVILVVAAVPFFPWRGRLYFQIYRTPERYRLREQAQTARWLRENRNTGYVSTLLTDPMTKFGLSFYLGEPVGNQPELDGHRLVPALYLRWQKKQPWDFNSLGELLKKYRVDRLLIADAGAPKPKESHLRKLSGQWSLVSLDIGDMASAELVQTCEGFVRAEGWKKTRVPPYYYLYEQR